MTVEVLIRKVLRRIVNYKQRVLASQLKRQCPMAVTSTTVIVGSHVVVIVVATATSTRSLRASISDVRRSTVVNSAQAPPVVRSARKIVAR